MVPRQPAIPLPKYIHYYSPRYHSSQRSMVSTVLGLPTKRSTCCPIHHPRKCCSHLRRVLQESFRHSKICHSTMGQQRTPHHRSQRNTGTSRRPKPLSKRDRGYFRYCCHRRSTGAPIRYYPRIDITRMRLRIRTDSNIRT